jgi:hypothetical protein
MGLFGRFRGKPKEKNAAMGMHGQPLEVLSGPSPHPDHHDRLRNAARIVQLEIAIEQFFDSGRGDGATDSGGSAAPGG